MVVAAKEEALGEETSTEELAATKMANVRQPLKRMFIRGRQKVG